MSWSPMAVRVMIWRERGVGGSAVEHLPPYMSRDLVEAIDGQKPKVWTNNAGEIDLSSVAMVELLDTMPAGHWAVVVTLCTNPAKEIVVDGGLDDWWYKHDKHMRKRIGANG